MTRFALPILTAIAALCCTPTTASAQDRDVPYWASLSSDEVNMRVGPSPNFPIDWVYHREGLPVKVVRMRQGWRLVQDHDGDQGWISGSLLTLERHAIVTGDDITQIRETGSADAAILWQVESGVVGKLGDCTEGWCEFDVEGRAGWILQERLWGTGEP